MNIIIVGCGKVGYTLASQLGEENHTITVIDKSQSKLTEAISSLDIQAILGSGTSYQTLMEAGVEEADLLIAVTDQDEINLLSCLIARKAGGCQTIARVRDPEYYQEISIIKEELGLSLAINPENTAASEITRLIHYPSALEVDTFAKGHINMVSVRIPEDSVLNGMTLIDYQHKLSRRSLVCIVQRGDEVIIPSGMFRLAAGDMISLIIPIEESYQFFKKIGIHAPSIRHVLLAGGGTISYYLTNQLTQAGVSVKIIEIDEERCSELAEMLPKATIICGDASDKGLLEEEGIADCDALVALTGIDEENILLSLYTHHVSSAKTITKINKIEFAEVIEEMNLGSIISPKNITAEYILRYVRSMQNSYGSNVETLYRLMGGRVEALEFIIDSNAKAIGIPLKDMKRIDNLLICSIYRNGKTITPSGDDMFEVGDDVVVVTTHKGLNGIDDILKP